MTRQIPFAPLSLLLLIPLVASDARGQERKSVPLDRERPRIEVQPDDGRRVVVRRSTERQQYHPPGTAIRRLPPGAREVRIGDRAYHRAGDVFYIPVGREPNVTYVVQRPPVGVVVSYVPEACEVVDVSGVRYYCFDDVYYLPMVEDRRARYRIVETPIGGHIVHLPEIDEWIPVGDERLARVGNRYYRQVFRNGRMVFVRVNYAPPQAYTVSGIVGYRGRAALPLDAVVHVRLLALGITGESARMLAEQIIRNADQPPIPFALKLPETSGVHPRYAVDAKIVSRGRTIYRLPRPIQVMAAASQRIELILDPAPGRTRHAEPLPPAEIAVVRGVLMYRERISLPPNADVSVRLVEVTGNQGVETVAEHVFRPRGGAPIPFEIEYDPTRIDPRGIYAIEARIRVGGNAWFYNEDLSRVLTRGYPDEIEIWLKSGR